MSLQFSARQVLHASVLGGCPGSVASGGSDVRMFVAIGLIDLIEPGSGVPVIRGNGSP